MTRKNWAMVALAVLLGGFSLYLNRDWFAKDNIQIFHRSRPVLRRGRSDDSPIEPIVFGFDRRLKLTALKVIAVSDLETNKFPIPLWNLISDSNSVPIKDFTYGMHIRGLHPVLKGAVPEPLQPGVQYRLFIEAGPKKAHHDFTPLARNS